MITRRGAIVTIAFGSLLAGSSVALADDSLDRARANGVSFGFSNEPPYVFLGPDGQAAGLNAEQVIAIFKRMGVKEVRPVLTEWASLIPGLNAGRFDLATPMFILPARCAAVSFGEPMSKVEGAMLVKKGNPRNLHSYEDAAKNSDVRVAVMAGAAEQKYLLKAGVPADRTVPLQDPGAMLATVISGRADAAALTPGSVRSMAEKGGGDVEAATPFTTSEWAVSYSSVPFRKSDVSLREAFNGALKEYLGSDEAKAIYSKYGVAPQLPSDMTTSKQCSKVD
ncbi:ectoine/hydroxyectoine ABC transporter substrate-binding protein EhuB [Bradyrhizobium sp. 193]|uniref:ectoine/hydroxyectoine ABC transporter substrate-binding protein EhuB n=1 Tax=Bradyrhizobium sp. 193 TaxID=2782661 RepID=UPI001FF926CE|nr:ectoine/hydroxyectoine ABC transporter substrate-binding protein EhuB [Bradyrhizobium sp. 193]MCK1481394.1 ectoine/hydroxyectoine ABC transporter substrate-binding protein EhuB [Bradyrhizobium sp. 193]